MTYQGAVTVRSPGKLFLLGEYAVLFGGPAIVQAVDRYVEVTVDAATGSAAGIEVCSLGARLTPLKAYWREELIYGTPAPEHELVMTILDALSAYGVLTETLGSIKCTIDSRALFHQHNKLGLGSSAAITHALTRAIVAYANERQAVAPLPSDFVFNVHRAFQHGRGSGADVGAGVLGGTFSFRRASEHTLPDMAAVNVPAGLHMTPVWAGKPSSTSQALGTLADFQTRHPGQFTAALTPLMELAEQGADALARSDSARFIQLCDEYSHNLSEFGRTVGVDIMSSPHRELRKLATNSGVVYKPSGAGNGDIGIAYSLDIKALARFAGKAEKAGFAQLTLGIGRACHRI